MFGHLNVTDNVVPHSSLGPTGSCDTHGGFAGLACTVWYTFWGVVGHAGLVIPLAKQI